MFEGFFKNFGFSRDAFRSRWLSGAYPEGICARKATKDKGKRRRKSAKDNFEMGSGYVRSVGQKHQFVAKKGKIHVFSGVLHVDNLS